MNFLSHYILDRNSSIYHNIGLTLPDVIALHNHNVGIKAPRVREIIQNTANRSHNDLLNAMLRHFELDKAFHCSDFFKNSVNVIMEEFERYTKSDKIAFYYAHILLEILLDRLVLEWEPQLNKIFYNEYKIFDFNEIADLFINIKNFNRQKFLDFCVLFANSTFLYGYSDKYSILGSLHKVTRRMGLEIAFKSDESNVVDFFDRIYEFLKPDMTDYFELLKK